MKLFKLLFSLAAVFFVLLAILTGASFAVYKISETGKIPEGKAGEIAVWLLQWHDQVLALVERVSA